MFLGTANISLKKEVVSFCPFSDICAISAINKQTAFAKHSFSLAHGNHRQESKYCYGY